MPGQCCILECVVGRSRCGDSHPLCMNSQSSGTLKVRLIFRYVHGIDDPPSPHRAPSMLHSAQHNSHAFPTRPATPPYPQKTHNSGRSQRIPRCTHRAAETPSSTRSPGRCRETVQCSCRGTPPPPRTNAASSHLRRAISRVKYPLQHDTEPIPKPRVKFTSNMRSRSLG